MAKIQSQQALQDAIRELEDRQLEEKSAIEQHFHESVERIKPANLIKDTLHDINSSEEIKKAILKAAVGLAIGYVIKKLIDKYLLKSKSGMKSGIGGIIQMLISAWVAKNGGLMKNIALHFFKLILNRRLKQRNLLTSTTTINI